MSVTRITNNTPSIFKKYQDQAFRAVGLEDGNAPAGEKQGKIFTSEVTSDDDYNVDYEATIDSFAPQLGQTGTLYNYTVVVVFEAELASGPISAFTFSTLAAGLTNGVYLCTTVSNDPGQGLGPGSGATFNVTVAGGLVTNVTLATAGDGYTTSNILTILGDQITGGASPADDITITITDIAAGTRSYGMFGNNLVKENDGFIIYWSALTGNHDYIRGFVNQVVEIVGKSLGNNVIEYNFTLLCTINDGDPKQIDQAGINNGDYKFYWKRNLYIDEVNYAGSTPPTNITASYNKFEKDGYFYWTDVNQSSLKHAIGYRRPDERGVQTLFQTFGPEINFNGELLPIVDTATGDVACIKITDPGSRFNWARRVEIKGTGEGAKFLAYPLSEDGSLPIHEYYLEELSSVGSISAPVQTTPFGQPLATISYSSISAGVIPNGTYLVPSTTPIGNGAGATFSVIVNAGAFIAVSLVAPGTNYTLSDVVVISGASFPGGVAPANNIVISPVTLVPTAYNAVSTTSGSGTGATFAVNYSSTGVLTATPNALGTGYTIGDTITILAADVGGAPATNITFTITGYGGAVIVRCKKTYYGWDYPAPQLDVYLEGVSITGGLSGDFVVTKPTLLSPGRFSISLEYAQDSATPVVFTATDAANNAEALLRIHNGVYRVVVGLDIDSVVGSNIVNVSPSTESFLHPYFVGAVFSSGGTFPAGTYITGISGISITLSNPAGATTTLAPAFVVGRGRNYLPGRVQAAPKAVKSDVKFFYDIAAVSMVDGNVPGNLGPDSILVWSVAGIYTNDTKNYTEWSEEFYVRLESQ